MEKSYQAAYEKAIQIVEILNAPSLSGYKCYWQYICGCLALAIDDKARAIYYFTQAGNNNCGGIRWFSDLIKAVNSNTEMGMETDYFFDIIESLEENICKFQNNSRFENRVKSILDGLLSADGHKFERAHLDLGILLGYDAHNSDDTAAPDPYWIINDDICIVAEDKIYEDDSKRIPVDDVRQAAGHLAWIRENVRTLNKDARIITIFVSNSTAIDDAARTFGKGIYYVQRKELCEWATDVINSLRTVRSSFQESGDANWRIKARETFISAQGTPKAFMDFVTRKEISDI